MTSPNNLNHQAMLQEIAALQRGASNVQQPAVPGGHYGVQYGPEPIAYRSADETNFEPSLLEENYATGEREAHINLAQRNSGVKYLSWAVLASTVIGISGYALIQNQFKGEKVAATRQVGPTPEPTLTPTVSASPSESTTPSPSPSETSSASPSATTSLSPTSTAIAAFAPKAVPCKTVAIISPTISEPMSQKVTLKGDPHIYNFLAGTHADFRSTISGTAKLEVCLTDPKLFVRNDAVSKSTGTETYDVDLLKVPTQLDVTGLNLEVVPNDQQILKDLCAAQSKLPPYSAKNQPPPPVCKESNTYKPGMVSDELNQVHAILDAEKTAIGLAQTAQLYRLIDAKVGELEDPVKSYVTTQFIDQVKAAGQGSHVAPPSYAHDLSAFAPPYITKNPAVNMKIAGLVKDYLAKYPKTKLSAFVLDDDAKSYTPQVVVKPTT